MFYPCYVLGFDYCRVLVQFFAFTMEQIALELALVDEFCLKSAESVSFSFEVLPGVQESLGFVSALAVGYYRSMDFKFFTTYKRALVGTPIGVCEIPMALLYSH